MLFNAVAGMRASCLIKQQTTSQILFYDICEVLSSIIFAEFCGRTLLLISCNNLDVLLV